MARRSSIIVTLLTLALIGATIAIAQDVTTRGTAVNVRSGPGTEYVVRAVLDNGYSVYATGRNNFDPSISCEGYPNQGNGDMWLRVQYAELEGWVNRCVVSLDGDIAGLAVVDPEAPELIGWDRPLYKNLYSSEPYDAYAFQVFTRAEAVLRQEPNLEAEVIGAISPGTRVKMIGRSSGEGWAKIKYGEYEGWVAQHLLDLPTGWEDAVTVQ
jgi:uncharacterized protein YraI